MFKKDNSLAYLNVLPLSFAAITFILQMLVVSPQVNAKRPKVYKMEFELAEKKLLDQFRLSIKELEGSLRDISIYKVKVTGELPQYYNTTFKRKLESIIVNSTKLSLKKCEECEVGIVTQKAGEIQYQIAPMDPDLLKQYGKKYQITHFLNIEVVYDYNDISMNVDLVGSLDGTVKWNRNFSVAELSNFKSPSLPTSSDDINKHLLLGQIAFKTSLSFGLAFLPNVINPNLPSNGESSGSSSLPNVSFVIGERYNQGYNEFGFKIGGMFKIGGDQLKKSSEKPLNWALTVGPQMKWVKNPFTVNSPKKAWIGEIGGIISSGFASAYIGVGYEVSYIKRYSILIEPIYVLEGNVSEGVSYDETDNGDLSQNSSSPPGTLGGMGLLLNANINW